MRIAAANSRRDRGTAVAVVLGLLAIMMLMIVLNARTLHVLKGEISLVEKRQQQHWGGRGAAK